MAEPDKRQIGDGMDDYAGAARQMANVARQASIKGAEATGRAAAAAVKAGAESGKAVAKVAAGTAAGGPWGAAVSAAWSMRHSLFKVLVCICLFLTVLIVLLTSLPSIVSNGVFGLDGQEPVPGATLLSSYTEMAAAVSDVIAAGYQASLEQVDQQITQGGYDYDLSMEALVNYAQSSAGYDVAYILSAYSVSMNQQNTTKDDMVAKLSAVADQMFPVTSQSKDTQQLIPVSYAAYEPITLRVITDITQGTTAAGAIMTQYDTEYRSFYRQTGTKATSTVLVVDAYQQVPVLLPVYTGSRITGTKTEYYYEHTGSETLTPTTETVTYLECTIQPFDSTVIAKAFGLDLDELLEPYHVPCQEVVQNMANSLKMVLYGSTTGGAVSSPLADAELMTFVNQQTCSPARKHILSTALSLVGRVPYFWGGKSAPGWNDQWNTPKVVTAAGSATTGTIRPFGLDCSGYTEWVYSTAVGVKIGAGTGGQYPNTREITAAELLPGDLAFLSDNAGGWSHVLLYAGMDDSGTRLWAHSSGGEGVILNTPSYEADLVFRRLTIVDYDAPISDDAYDTPLYTLDVDVTHYCACTKCCGEDATGITASGKAVATGMVAMSSQYPFGTQIMINGTMYTVEDRGGSGIENDIHRVDIYIPDHNQALQLGRYTTTATIYRIGR